MGSTRLERKVLRPIAGKPLIQHQIDRVKGTHVDQVALCTTTNPADDELAEAGRAFGVEVYRGPETDVPRRLWDAARHFDLSHFVLCEADEHWVDPKHVDQVVEEAALGGDWVHVDGNPIGAWLRCVSVRGMELLCTTMNTDGLDGWGGFFEKDPRCDMREFRILDDKRATFADQVRLTIDYPEDFELAEQLYEKLDYPAQPYSVIDVLDALAADPGLVEINLHRQDQYWERIKAQSAGLLD